jgi:hypothetical protein
MRTVKAYIKDAKENKYLNWEALACYYVDVIIFLRPSSFSNHLIVEKSKALYIYLGEVKLLTRILVTTFIKHPCQIPKF